MKKCYWAAVFLLAIACGSSSPSTPHAFSFTVTAGSSAPALFEGDAADWYFDPNSGQLHLAYASFSSPSILLPPTKLLLLGTPSVMMGGLPIPGTYAVTGPPSSPAIYTELDGQSYTMSATLGTVTITEASPTLVKGSLNVRFVIGFFNPPASVDTPVVIKGTFSVPVTAAP